MAAEEFAASYQSTLRDLTFNSKPHISVLTMLAEENVQNAPQIVKIIEAHLHRVKPECKLPTMYLIDSIVKNVGHAYASLFVQNLVSTFCGVFEKVDEKIRMQLFKLRQTWADIFPNKKLYAIDMRVKQLDPAWPVTAQPPQQPSIHVNPKFLKSTVEEQPPPAPTLEAASRKLQDLQEEEMRKQLLAKQQELLRLQRQKLELELIQTQVMVEEQKRQLIIKEQQVLRVQQHADAEVQKALQQQQQQQQQRHNMSVVAAAALVAQVAKAKAQKSLPMGLQVGSPTNQSNADSAKNVAGDDSCSPHIDAVTSTSMPHSSQMTVQLTLPNLTKNKLTIDSNSVEKTEPIGAATTQKTLPPKSDDSLSFDPSKHVVVSAKTVGSANDSSNAAAVRKAISKVKVGAESSSSSSSSSKRKEKDARKSKKTASPKKKEEKASSSSSTSASKDQSSSSNKSSIHKKSSSSKGSSKGSGGGITKGGGDRRGHSRSPLHGDKDERPSKRSRRSPRKEKENDETKSTTAAAAAAIISTTTSVSLSAPCSSSSNFLPHKGDVDLRTPIDMTCNKDGGGGHGPSLDKADGEPPVKKSKSDDSDLDDIFSGKDQDYRQLGRPVPRLSPIGEQSSWAQYKASRPNEFKNPLRLRDNMNDPFGFGNQDMDLRQEQQQQQQQQQQHQQHQQQNQVTSMNRPHPWMRDASRGHPMLSDRDPRMSRRGGVDIFRPIHGMGGAGGGRFAPRMMMIPQQQIYQATQESDPNIPRALMFDRGAEIMRQADQQLRTGQLTIEQHAEIMEQLAKLYELQRMRHMQREQHVRETVILNRKISRNEENAIRHSPASSVATPTPTADIYQDKDEEIKNNEKPKDAPPIEKMDVDADADGENSEQTKDAIVLDVSSVPLPPSSPVPPVVEPSTTDKEEDKKDGDKNQVVKNGGANDGTAIGEQNAKEIEVIVIDDEPKVIERRGVRVPSSANAMHTAAAAAAATATATEAANAATAATVAASAAAAAAASSNALDNRQDGKRRESRWSSPLNAPPGGPMPPMRPMARPPNAPAINTVMIDDKPREVRFIDGKAIVVLENDDIREIGFRGPPQDIIFDKQVIRLGFANTIKDFEVDNMTHTIRFGAPTREVIVDGVPFAAVFGGPPIMIHLRGKQHELRLSGPTPEVFFGDKPRHDLLPLLNMQKPQQQPPHRPDSPMARYSNEFVGGGREVPWRAGPPPPQSAYLDDQPPFRRGAYHPGDRRPPDWMREEEFHRRGVRGRHVVDDYYDREARHSPYRGEQPVDQSAAGFHPRFAHPPFRPNGPPPPHPGMHPRFDGPSGGGPPPHRPPPPARHPTMVQYPIPFGYRHVAPPAHNEFGFGPNGPPIRTPTMVPPPPMPVPAPSQINVSELFSKLVATGIIPQTAKNADKVDESQAATASTAKISEEGDADKIPLIELALDSLRVRQTTVVSALYCGIQCSSCGVRFTAEQTDKYAQHLDWHFRQNRREKGSGSGGGSRKALLSRRWHYELQDWVQFEEFEDLEERARSFFELQASEEQGDIADGSTPSVPAGENEEDKKCCVCQEPFELYWDEDQEEWHFKDAVRRDEKNYHPLCYEDIKERQGVEETAEETMAVDQTAESERGEIAVKESVDGDGVATVKTEASVEVKVEDAVKVEQTDADVEMERPTEQLENAAESEQAKIEETNESLSIFNVMVTSYSVPPGIGLEVEPEERTTELANGDVEGTKENAEVVHDKPIESLAAEHVGEQLSEQSNESGSLAKRDDNALVGAVAERTDETTGHPISESRESESTSVISKDADAPVETSAALLKKTCIDPTAKAVEELMEGTVSVIVDEPMEQCEAPPPLQQQQSNDRLETEASAMETESETKDTQEEQGRPSTSPPSKKCETEALEVVDNAPSSKSEVPASNEQPPNAKNEDEKHAPSASQIVSNEMSLLAIVDDQQEGRLAQTENVDATSRSKSEDELIANVDVDVAEQRRNDGKIDNDGDDIDVPPTISPCPEFNVDIPTEVGEGGAIVDDDDDMLSPPSLDRCTGTITQSEDAKTETEVVEMTALVSCGDFEEDVALKESSDVIVDFAFETSSPLSRSKPEKSDDGMENADEADDDDDVDDEEEEEVETAKVGRTAEFTVLAPVMRGTELSGLCSLM